MKSKTMRSLTAVTVLLLLAACNLPAGTTPTPFTFPTPDLTLTAIFSPLAVTATSPALVATATQAAPAQVTATSAVVNPSATQAPPTNTSQPAATNTQAAPTNTSGPTRTSAPLVRGGTSIRASFVSTAPTIDGDLSEWTAARYDVKTVVFGRDKWEDEVDLSGYVMAAWDNNYLYLAGHVYDNDFVQEAEDENLFKGDSVEILMDARLDVDYYTTSLSPDDFQIGVSPGQGQVGNNPQAYRWFPTSVEGELTNVKIGTKLIVDDYEYELAIPWSVFETTASAGKHFGFAVSYSDNDTYATEQQESMVSTSANRRLTDPTTWGDLLLGN